MAEGKIEESNSGVVCFEKEVMTLRHSGLTLGLAGCTSSADAARQSLTAKPLMPASQLSHAAGPVLRGDHEPLGEAEPLPAGEALLLFGSSLEGIRPPVPACP
mmetsp:Transcript_15497/g.48928  ORF Transcript_15497/g.48928 Transcript_15497/m.48928 type:complete len:103 (-) Transcript_15497:856-1164(-)